MTDVADFLEVKLPKDSNFLVVRETLTRIGLPVAPRDGESKGSLIQSCHILHKRGRYYIVHFKEMLALDGKNVELTDDDIARRNRIALLLAEWKLVEIADTATRFLPVAPLSSIKVISFEEKDQWNLVPKYNIGKKSRAARRRDDA